VHLAAESAAAQTGGPAAAQVVGGLAIEGQFAPPVTTGLQIDQARRIEEGAGSQLAIAVLEAGQAIEAEQPAEAVGIRRRQDRVLDQQPHLAGLVEQADVYASAPAPFSAAVASKRLAKRWRT
jgi:hypothetical protein